MPYIKQEERRKFKENTAPARNFARLCSGPGDLNYLLTIILKEYVKSKDECYTTYNEVMGVLTCCTLEFYRKNISPYEEKKIQENGDVF